MDRNTEAIIMMKCLRRNNQQHHHLRQLQSFHGRPYDRVRGFSCPPPRRRGKTVYNRYKSVTPRKSKRSVNKGEAMDMKLSGSDPLGPDPDDLPKNISRAILTFSPSSSSSSSSSSSGESQITRGDKIYSGPVSTIAPPPSSLPLPMFSVRPKLSCKTEAAAGEIDIGATHNLRRLLGLQ